MKKFNFSTLSQSIQAIIWISNFVPYIVYLIKKTNTNIWDYFTLPDFYTLFKIIIVSLSDEATDLATGTGKASFHMPYAMSLSKVKASVNTAPVGATIIVDINENGTTILSTKLSID